MGLPQLQKMIYSREGNPAFHSMVSAKSYKTYLNYEVNGLVRMKINRNSQAAILPREHLGELFQVVPDRYRLLFGICCFTSCHIAEAIQNIWYGLEKYFLSYGAAQGATFCFQ